MPSAVSVRILKYNGKAFLKRKHLAALCPTDETAHQIFKLRSVEVANFDLMPLESPLEEMNKGNRKQSKKETNVYK